MNWYPDKRRGLLWGAGVILALLLVDGALLYVLWRVPMGPGAFALGLVTLGSVALTTAVAYIWYGLLSLAYRSDRNGIVIRWGVCFEVIPAAEIKRVVTLPRVRIRGGLGWPGYRFGRAYVAPVGRARLYLSGSLSQAVVIETHRGDYVISPADVAGFLADSRARCALGPTVAWEWGVQWPRWLRLTIWRDRLAAGLALAALLLNLGLVGHLSVRYPQLREPLALSLSARGMADRIGTRRELFMLPVCGLLLLLLNGALAVWMHRRERLWALLLLGSAVLVQALALLAARRLA